VNEPETALSPDPQAYVQQVMAEIAEEVRVRRASGELPPKLERELDELFLAHSPVAGRGGDLGEALRMVDAATFIDPVVPVDSNRAAGAAIKKGMRSALLWYVGWLTHQMSQSASAVSRALHIVDARLGELERAVEAQRVPDAGVIEFGSDAEAWWAGPATDAVASAPGRVLHAACGDGWLVRRMKAAGGDAYGIDPRPGLIDAAELGVLDLRCEVLSDHLHAVAPAGLAGLVVSGLVDGMPGGEREQLLALVSTRLAPGGTLVVHSVTRAAWESADAPIEADLAAGRPLRADSWCRLLARAGFDAQATPGPTGGDYLVTAVRAATSPFPAGPADR
jgi:hypothetical protein